jgi:murein DD-endopeptidase MepM/ murein hydrolase activator NlpD
LVCLFFILSAVILINLEAPPGATETISDDPGASAAPPKEPAPEAPAVAVPAPPLPVPPAVKAEIEPTPSVPAAGESDISYLRGRGLLIPVEGVGTDKLRDSFLDSRSEGRQHLALDIMAPQGTAVRAAASGKVLRLYQSEMGGIMLYQQDGYGPYVYYYGHLLRYADGIHEGKSVSRGEVIAYVGDTGNAGAGNYHLHFGISRIDTPGKWSGGVPINPYPLLTGK